jgi:hypothetical protein
MNTRSAPKTADVNLNLPDGEGAVLGASQELIGPARDAQKLHDGGERDATVAGDRESPLFVKGTVSKKRHACQHHC